jgi:hypothetical protein
VVQERGARPRGAGQSQERGICAFTEFTFAKCFLKRVKRLNVINRLVTF